jgi:hypothetical protein
MIKMKIPSVSYIPWSLVMLFILQNLQVQAQQNLFQLLSPQESGVNFYNYVYENKDANITVYEYIYNGGGTAIGDLNNDGLSDIIFTGNVVEHAIYINQGGLKFKNIIKTALKSPNIGYSTGVTILDINNDGWQDFYISKSASSQPEYRKHQLYINNKDLTFTDRAEEYGLADASFTTQSYFRDFDNDGDLDLFMLNHPQEMGQAKKIVLEIKANKTLEVVNSDGVKYQTNMYYENVNGKFIDKTMAAGLQTNSFGLSAILSDFNADGYCDILTSNDYVKPNVLYLNNKNGTFTDQTDKYIQHQSHNSMGSDFADLDNDGYDDLITLDMLPESNFRAKQFRMLPNYDEFQKYLKYKLKAQVVKNVVDWNHKGEGFSDVSDYLGMSNTDWSWAPLIADFDNNGHKDVYITNGYYRDLTDQDIVRYRLDSVAKEIRKMNSVQEIEKTLNQYPTVKTNNYFFANQGNFKFDKNPKFSGLDTASWSNSAVYADLDNDGDLEIVVNNVNQYAFVFKNNSSELNLGNFVRFQLASIKGQAFKYGTKIEVITEDNKTQTIHFYPNKGYLSQHEEFIHFGLGKSNQVTAIITLTDGRIHRMDGLSINQVHQINLDELVTNYIPEKQNFSPKFEQINAVNHTTFENDYNDFKQEPLLPHRFSMSGPTITVGDVNGDQLEDFYIGGATGFEGKLYVQNSFGKFTEQKSPSFVLDKLFEDGKASFIDYDKDGDNDLIVTCGGNEFPYDKTKYHVRLYKNDGKGNFGRVSTESMPTISISSKAVAIGDYNKDGFPDVFIGGGVVPGHYGKRPESFLLKNESGKFAKTNSCDFSSIGMVSDALWVDYDQNGWDDLLIVGRWMSPMVYENLNGTLAREPKAIGDFSGWWTSVQKADLNYDGKIDFIFGNYGTNTRYKGTKKEPLYMMVNDFDRNGSTDAIIGYHQAGNVFPIHTRDNLLDQVPKLKKKFNRYHKYSIARIQDIFDSSEMVGVNYYTANFMSSGVAMSSGKGTFQFKALPIEAQLFPVNAINTYDYDNDGDLDLLLSGNDYGLEIESGRHDAGRGLVLQNNGDNSWTAVYHTGYQTIGDVKTVSPIRIGSKASWLVGKNNGKLEVLQAK